jgi:EmrB/QacA subfamily drug resistance transporter
MEAAMDAVVGVVPASKADPRRWQILFTILAVEVMDLLDGTIVNVAAPSIRGALNTSLAALQWVTGGYALAFAVGLVTGGRLGDLLGRRTMFLIGVAGFVASSAACGLAMSIEALIVARLVQGLFAASMIPQGFGLVREAFPPDELGKAFGLFGPVIGGSAILGPIVGGVLVDANLFGWGWRSIFLVNVPLGLAALVAGVRLLPKAAKSTERGLDVFGAVLVSAVAGGLIGALIQGPESGWPAWSYALIGASAMGLAGFVAFERSRERRGLPVLVPMRLFENRAFSAGLAVVLVFFACMIGLTFMLSVLLQVGSGFSAIKTGLSMAPWAFGTAVGSVVSSQALAPKIGRSALHVGLITLLAGVSTLTAVVHFEAVTPAVLAGPMVLCGLGMGAMISPLFNFVLAGIGDRDVGSGSGVLNAIQQLGGAAGIAVLGTVFFAQVRVGQLTRGFEQAAMIELALLVACAGLVFLLPRKAREDGH